MYSSILDAPVAQTEPLNKRQIKNHAGGYVYQASDWDILDRFLILGVMGNTYYVKRNSAVKENFDAIKACINENGIRVVNRLTEISRDGRAIKQDPAIFVLALCLKIGDEATRRAASDAIYLVCRTGTHLLSFVAEAEGLKQGWGRLMKKGVGKWFTERDDHALAYQYMKYAQRKGWALADLLRLSHPAVGENQLLKYILGRAEISGDARIEASKSLAGMSSKKAAKIIQDHRLPREAVPTTLLNDPAVWEALAYKMPMTALVRNLGKMTSVGVIASGSSTAEAVYESLTNAEALKAARIHPVALLIAMSVYAQGRGIKGDLTWNPVSNIISGLSIGISESMKTAQGMGVRNLVAIDVSGSMQQSLPNIPSLQLHQITACMAVAANQMEPKTTVVGITTGWNYLDVSGRRFDDLAEALPSIPSGTDLAQAVFAADDMWSKNKQVVDLIQVYTDNETWAGHQHFDQALDNYRSTVNPDVKVAICTMVPNSLTVGDPKDSKILQCVGFDAGLPQVLAGFMGRETAPTEED